MTIHVSEVSEKGEFTGMPETFLAIRSIEGRAGRFANATSEGIATGMFDISNFPAILTIV